MPDSLPAKCDNCSNTSYTLNVTWLTGEESYTLLCNDCQQELKSEEDRS